MEHMLHPTNQIDIRAWLMQKSEIRGFPKPVFFKRYKSRKKLSRRIKNRSLRYIELMVVLVRVVLAGDHMQLEPEVVSPYALEKRLNLSLLGNDRFSFISGT